jgi:glutaredoxin
VIRVELYTRDGCHLCEDAKAVLEKVRGEVPFELREIDIDGDAALVERYGIEIPVIVVDGRKHAKYRVDEAAFRRRLAGEEPA